MSRIRQLWCGLAQRHDMKGGMSGKEGCDLLLVLLGQHGTRGVHEPSTGLHKPRGACEDTCLQRQQAIKPGSQRAPACIWITPPSAGATARRIDQHATKVPLWR